MADNGFGKLSMQLTTATSTSVRMARCHRSRRRCGSWRWGGRYGSPEAAVAAVAWGPACRRGAFARRARVAGVDRRPDSCGGGQYLQEAGAAVTESGAARRQQRKPAGRLSAAAGGGRGCAYGSGTGVVVQRVAFKEGG